MFVLQVYLLTLFQKDCRLIPKLKSCGWHKGARRYILLSSSGSPKGLSDRPSSKNTLTGISVSVYGDCQGSLPYTRKCLEAAVVVKWHSINKTQLNRIDLEVQRPKSIYKLCKIPTVTNLVFFPKPCQSCFHENKNSQ